MIDMECVYVSSSGEQKDVRQLDTQYLINALAKAYRDFFETKDTTKYMNINNIQSELKSRTTKFISEGEKE